VRQLAQPFAKESLDLPGTQPIGDALRPLHLLAAQKPVI
jgi:hypothetical protein